jgi:hypothetical protein
MANTNVVIQDDLGMRVPSVPSVPIISGDTVTFNAGPSADSVLYFSPSTAAILTPSPGAPISLASGAEMTYTFATPAGQAYGVIVQAPEAPAPSEFDFGPPAEPPTLVIQPGEGSSFPGPTQPIRTG